MTYPPVPGPPSHLSVPVPAPPADLLPPQPAPRRGRIRVAPVIATVTITAVCTFAGMVAGFFHFELHDSMTSESVTTAAETVLSRDYGIKNLSSLDCPALDVAPLNRGQECTAVLDTAEGPVDAIVKVKVLNNSGQVRVGPPLDSWGEPIG